MLTIPDEENGAATDRLLRPYFGMHRFEWSDDDSVEFHLPHGEMLALMRQSGFVVEQLLEIRPPDGSTTRYPFVTLDWARHWPCEEVWRSGGLRRVDELVLLLQVGKCDPLSLAPFRPIDGGFYKTVGSMYLLDLDGELRSVVLPHLAYLNDVADDVALLC